VKGGY
jgi:hypothetical protein